MNGEPSVPETAPRLPEPALARIYELLRLVVVLAGLMLAIWLLGNLLMIVFAAALLAVILHGISAMVQRATSIPFWAALAIVVIGTAAAFVALALLAGPGLSAQASALKQALTAQAAAIQDRLNQTEWGRLVLQQVPSSFGGQKEQWTPRVPTGFAGSVAGIVGAVVGVFGTLAVVLITAIYLAAAPTTYVNGVLRLVAVRHRAKAKELCLVAGHTLWAWAAGQSIDMLVVGILSGLGLWLIGVPLAFVLGVVAGLANFVPYIGAIGGAVPAVIIAFSAGSTQGLETLALYLVIQGLEGNVLAPMIQKRAADLPPGLTILAQTGFGVILGLPGLIFATPLTAAILAVMDKATPPLAPSDAL